jgi:ribose 1,5-bisphosphokinase
LPEPGTTRPEARPHRAGTLVLVVGPSGTGKDTLIAYARETLREHSDAVFPRRFITRRADPASENYIPVSVDAFQRMLADGRFALSWERHGLHYGVPAEIDAAIGSGAVAIVNVSRAIVRTARTRYADVLCIHVTAPSQVLAERLGSRGRENAEDVERRLGRIAEGEIEQDTVRIVNDASIEKAGKLLVRAVLRLQEA